MWQPSTDGGMESFREYLLTNHDIDITQILRSHDLQANFSINIDFLKLFEADPTLGEAILCDPKIILPKCNETIILVQKSIISENENQYSLKNKVNARFFNLPVCPELHRSTVPRNNDLNCFIKITGTVIRLTQSKMLEYKKNYECSKCKHIQIVEGKYEYRYIIKPPAKCKNPDIQCRSSTFSPIHQVSRDNCKDYQEMKIQEQVNKSAVGGIPGSIWVTLENDLVDCCKPGDDVYICGIVLRRWHAVSINKKCEVELVFKANHIEVCNVSVVKSSIAFAPDLVVEFDEFWSKYNKYPMKGRDIIISTVCPKVYGLYIVKLALLLTVITGCSQNSNIDEVVLNKSIISEDKTSQNSIRGQCHLLLVGDPGTGKSQLLKAASVLTSRSVLTSGSGSTKAGLTCTALREDGEWQLEAGALVLADGGTCCIDELAQMREHDRASIHEAMEQQTISVAKAGIICKLNTRCAVVAACNPKGSYDIDQPLSINVSLGTPLLSRFDLIFILLDKQNDQWDDLLTDYVLFGKNFNDERKVWPLEKLKLYLSYTGPLEASMTSEATTVLRAYYIAQRRTENRDPSRTTVRMLDSLVRLSQAHARLMYRNVVNAADAVTAVILMDLSMQDCTVTGTSDALQSNFSDCPDFQYLISAKQLLLNLDLDDIWQNELLRYSYLLSIDSKSLDNDIETGNYSAFTQLHETNTSIKPETIVQSSFFTSTANLNNEVKENDSCERSESIRKIILDSDSEYDSDQIFNLDAPKKNKTDTKTQTESNFSIKNSGDKLFSLAKSLKKHSSLNKNADYVGPITTKRKRFRKKKDNLKSKTSTNENKKEQDSNIKNSSKKKVSKKEDSRNNKKKRKVIGNNEDNDNFISQSAENLDNEMTEIQVLNCLPSVNDVFKDLKASFTDSNSDEEIFIENSDAANATTMNNKSTEKSNESEKDNSFSKSITTEPRVCENTLLKLQNYSFKASKVNDNNKENKQLSPPGIDFCVEQISAQSSICIENGDSIKCKLKNNENIEYFDVTNKNENTRKIVTLSQRSIFEDLDDDYDHLQL